MQLYINYDMFLSNKVVFLAGMLSFFKYLRVFSVYFCLESVVTRNVYPHLNYAMLKTEFEKKPLEMADGCAAL